VRFWTAKQLVGYPPPGGLFLGQAIGLLPAGADPIQPEPMAPHCPSAN